MGAWKVTAATRWKENPYLQRDGEAGHEAGHTATSACMQCSFDHAGTKLTLKKELRMIFIVATTLPL